LGGAVLTIVPVANPEGYDASFETGMRDWRRNRRSCTPTDNNGVLIDRNFTIAFGEPESSPTCLPDHDHDFRGAMSGSEREVIALRDILDSTGEAEIYGSFPTVIAVNLASVGDRVRFAGGLSAVALSPCSTDDNCTPAGLPAFWHFGGTAALPRITDADTNAPYVDGTSFQIARPTSGDFLSEALYEGMNADKAFAAHTIEFFNGCAQADETINPLVLEAQFEQLKGYVDDMLAVAASDIDDPAWWDTNVGDVAAPHVTRRDPATEFPTPRFSVRRGPGLTVGPPPGSGLTGSFGVEDLLEHRHYDQAFFAADGGYKVPSELVVCLQGVGCSTLVLDEGAVSDFCSSDRYDATASGWTFIGPTSAGPADECFWTLSSVGAGATLDFKVAPSRSDGERATLSYSYRWDRDTVTQVRVLVSTSPTFAGCTGTTGGPCRIVRQYPHADAVDDRDEGYRTEVIDLRDFDLEANLFVRIQIDSVSGAYSAGFSVYDLVVNTFRSP
jgi:hypothetical protein